MNTSSRKSNIILSPVEYIKQKYGGGQSSICSMISQRQAPFDTSVYIDEISDEEEKDFVISSASKGGKQTKLTFANSPSFLTNVA